MAPEKSPANKKPQLANQLGLSGKPKSSWQLANR